ncbi:MAG: TetR/AcrR family transcriptional regulator [Treponema sp.]|jgi:AcrR family transcriptional regulator|nr:TetR/AcrR family transcriptional regulator [Treponema sp.]
MTKEDIINAAFRVWGRNRYKDTSLSKVAACLKVTKPALYRHFADKQALLDAMYAQFFDHYAGFLKPVLEEARKIESNEGLLMITRAVIDYYVRNEDYYIFSLIQVGEKTDPQYNTAEQLNRRGVPLTQIRNSVPGGTGYPSLVFLAVITVTFYIALFHRKNRGSGKPGEAKIRAFVADIEKRVRLGLGFDGEAVKALDYERLEALSRIGAADCDGNSGLLKGVAAAVAEAGPWNASMEMVAQRSGLSKSGLYAHFKSKQDMLSWLFTTESDQIARLMRCHTRQIPDTAERLYLAILSVADYLRAKPEILIVLDWARIQRMDLDITVPMEIYEFFRELGMKKTRLDPSVETVAQWILFLVVKTMIRRPVGMEFADISNETFRVLYRFITSGIGGFRNGGAGLPLPEREIEKRSCV